MATQNKVIKFGDVSRRLILLGARDLARAVVSTFGPKGGNVLIDNGSPIPKITKDGVTAAKAVQLSNPYRRIGASLLKEVASKVESATGDGTTTSVLFTYTLLIKVEELLEKGVDPRKIKKGLNQAKKDALEFLETNKKEVKGKDDIYHIAYISSNGNEEISENIAEAFDSIGEGGIVTMAASNDKDNKTYVKTTDGMTFDEGYYSNAFALDGSKAIVDDPLVLIFNQTMFEFDGLENILYRCKSANGVHIPVIMAPKFDEAFVGRFVEFMQELGIPGVLSYTPGAAYTKAMETECVNDLACALNTRVLKMTDLASIEDLEQFETVKRITIGKAETTIEPYEDKLDAEKIDARVKLIKASIEEAYNSASTADEIQLIKARLASLTGGIATIYIGALTKPEMEEKADLYEDAINSVKSAIADGILPGGGTAMYKAAVALKDKKDIYQMDTSEKLGYQALIDTLKEPFYTLLKSDIGSSNLELLGSIASIVAGQPFFNGYNIMTGCATEDLSDSVIDPYNVEKYVILYATSLIETFSLVKCTITNERDNVRGEDEDLSLWDEDE